MNKMYKQAVAVLSIGLFLSFSVFIPKASAQYENVNVSYNDFYQDLAPYGMWIDDPHYGYVWSPTVGEDFRPYYTNGYWVMTDYGNTWVSGYSWGWACFHYGRWIYDSYYGWLWIPGSNWGPAWVSWRYGEGYYGWAPLSPGYEFGSYGDYYCPNDWWVFIPPQYIYTGNYYRYWYGPHSNATIITNTTFVNNTYVNNGITYVSGPRQHDIEQVTHQPVQVFHITNSNNRNTRVHNTSIRMFRPAEIRPASTAGGQRVAPPNVVKAPQPIRNPQAVNKGQTTPPQFRNDVPQNNGRTATPGTGFNETAKPAQQQPARNDHNPYEWDANKQQHTRDMYQAPEQPQTQPRQFEQQPVQRNEPPRQAPAPAPQPRPVPAPQPRPMPAPQPRQAPPPPPQRPAPAPAPRETGGRR